MTSEAGLAFPWRDVAPAQTDDGWVLEASVREPERFALIFDRYFGALGGLLRSCRHQYPQERTRTE